MNALLILNTILILLVLITLHEFGHFIVAKMSKMYVHEFAIGFGPKLFSWGKNETSYSLRLLPIGGYVLVAQHAAKHFFPDLYGYTEENDELIKTHDMKIPIKRLYENVSFPKKILFILAGIILNLLFGMLCFYI